MSKEHVIDVHRLSERNCIEIIAKLVEEKKLDVVHTLDGKEYITPTQISREIRDELYVHGGLYSVVNQLFTIICRTYCHNCYLELLFSSTYFRPHQHCRPAEGVSAVVYVYIIRTSMYNFHKILTFDVSHCVSLQ